MAVAKQMWFSQRMDGEGHIWIWRSVKVSQSVDQRRGTLVLILFQAYAKLVLYKFAKVLLLKCFLCLHLLLSKVNGLPLCILAIYKISSHTVTHYISFHYICLRVSLYQLSPNTEQDPLFAIFLAVHYPFLFNSEVNLFLPLKTVSDQSSHVAGINGFTSPYVAQVTQTTRDGWTLNFIRECMKINKVCSKSHSVKKKEIKISHLEFMLCVLLFVRF